MESSAPQTPKKNVKQLPALSFHRRALLELAIHNSRSYDKRFPKAFLWQEPNPNV
jgi:hypothetical protein